MMCRNAFSISELSDVVWGLLRLKMCENDADQKQHSLLEVRHTNLLSDNRIYAIYKRVEDLIMNDDTGLKYLRP